MNRKNVENQYFINFPYYSRHGQDRYLNEHVFHGMKKGVFVDIGAYDGIESSNTLFFEETLDWNGICVEPLPQVFEALKVNRKCFCLNKCVTNYNGYCNFMHVKPARKIPSFEKGRTSNCEKLSGVVDFFPQEQCQLIDKIIEVYGGTKEILEIECVRINDVLELVNSTSIDLLSIDTEGSEYVLIQDIDFKKFNFRALVIETLYNYMEIVNYLSRKGYQEVIKIGYDSIFIRAYN